MIDRIETGYIKEIEDVEWLAEVISERFDNALSMMSTQSVIYGGAVRDTIAEKELLGDLDIAVTPEAFSEMSAAFQENPRWVPHDPSRSGPVVGKTRNSGDMARELAPMSNVSSFINMNGMVAQLITSNDHNKDRLQAAMFPARQVDIVCCGVVMLADGRVFEVLPGAFDDCKNGILRINEDSDTIYLDTLKSRVDKFIGRGWKNTINVEKVIKEIKIRRNRTKKLRRGLPPQGLINIDEVEQHVFIHDPDEGAPMGGHMQEIRNPEKYGEQGRLVMVIDRIARNYSYNVRVVTSPLGQVYIECQDGHKAHQITRDLQQILIKKKKSPITSPSMKKWRTGGTATGRITSSGAVEQRLYAGGKPMPVSGSPPVVKGGIRIPRGSRELSEEPNLYHSGKKVLETVEVPSPYDTAALSDEPEVEVEIRSNDGETLSKMTMTASEADKLKNGWEGLDDEDKARILNEIANKPTIKFKGR